MSISEVPPNLEGKTLNIVQTDFTVHGRAEMERYLAEHGLDNTQSFIGSKARANYEQILRKQRPDMSEEEIKATLDFLHSLEDSKEKMAVIGILDTN
ncbi:MAG: hypothetical protein IJ632_02160 [Muribaculaceae bacterium]|nr:hypothetical protein [Muribaculaceae bacterium]